MPKSHRNSPKSRRHTPKSAPFALLRGNAELAKLLLLQTPCSMSEHGLGPRTEAGSLGLSPACDPGPQSLLYSGSLFSSGRTPGRAGAGAQPVMGVPGILLSPATRQGSPQILMAGWGRVISSRLPDLGRQLWAGTGGHA